MSSLLKEKPREEKKERINVVMPASLVAELRRLLPPRERSRFIVRATADRLLQLKQRKALEEAVGAWKDENHPELADGVEAWRDELRRATQERWKEMGIID